MEYVEVDETHELNCRENMERLLSGDLDFHNRSSSYGTHNFHAFPAKFPPQLPARFIASLTRKGDVVLDPMMGSGTTVLEAYLTGRKGIGLDIDPLAVKMARVKTTPIDVNVLLKYRKNILHHARERTKRERDTLRDELRRRWSEATKKFIDYWFAVETQLELMALILEISAINEIEVRSFFELALSATIITKSGGVSLALDLAHTRPHKAKVVVLDVDTDVNDQGIVDTGSRRLRFQTKKLRSAIEEFDKRCLHNIEALVNSNSGRERPFIGFSDAQKLPLKDASVDLIVTSPPYASNAIDYMRAHKFSLTWLGYSIDKLGRKRKDYIGGEVTSRFEFEELPEMTSGIVAKLTAMDLKRGKVLHRYYSEMTRVLREMYRVLKHDTAAILVVGNSVMRGMDTRTQECLAEIGERIGFEVPKIGVRKLDRNKRMMPAGNAIDRSSQIQHRMHVEYVIGFYKV